MTEWCVNYSTPPWFNLILGHEFSQKDSRCHHPYISVGYHNRSFARLCRYQQYPALSQLIRIPHSYYSSICLDIYSPWWNTFPPRVTQWLVKCGHNKEDAISLARYTGSSSRSMEVEVKVNKIITNLELEMKLGTWSYLDCFRSTKDKMALHTLTAIFVQAFQQLTGSPCFHSVSNI